MGRRSRKKSGASPRRDEIKKKSVYHVKKKGILGISIILSIVLFYCYLRFCGNNILDIKNVSCAIGLGEIGKKMADHVKAINEGLQKSSELFQKKVERIQKIISDHEPKPPPNRKGFPESPRPIEAISYIWLISIKPVLAKVFLLFGLS